jgi:hypothetical protein
MANRLAHGLSVEGVVSYVLESSLSGTFLIMAELTWMQEPLKTQ